MSRQWQNLINDIWDATALFLNKHRTSRSIPHPAHWRTAISSQVYTDLLPHHNPMCAWCAVTQQSSIIKHRGDSEKIKINQFQCFKCCEIVLWHDVCRILSTVRLQTGAFLLQKPPSYMWKHLLPSGMFTIQVYFQSNSCKQKFYQEKKRNITEISVVWGGQVLELWLPISLQKTLAEHCL